MEYHYDMDRLSPLTGLLKREIGPFAALSSLEYEREKRYRESPRHVAARSNSR